MKLKSEGCKKNTGEQTFIGYLYTRESENPSEKMQENSFGDPS